LESTKINCLTGGSPVGAMLPVSFNAERQILDSALATVGLVEPQNTGVLWIKNTLEVAELECSEKYFDEAQTRDDLEIVSDLRDLRFDENDDLAALSPATAHAS